MAGGAQQAQDPNAQGSANPAAPGQPATQDGSAPGAVPQQPPYNLSRESIEREIMSLVEQHNIKVQQISCAVGIINTLHLFCQRSDNGDQQDFARMTAIVKQLLDFQRYLVEEFRERFE